MKKKLFEKLPPEYEGEKTKETGYAVSAFVQDETLAVDFYEENQGLWKAIWRTVINKKEFCNYRFDINIWDERQIDSIASALTQCNYRHSYNCEQYKYLGTSKSVISGFIKLVGGSNYQNVQNTISHLENTINWNKRESAAERKNRRIQERMALAPEVPEDFKEFISEKLFKHDHFMYVSKEKAVCSRCGKSFKKAAGIKHNAEGTCPCCEMPIVYKMTGRMSEHVERKEVLLIQKQDEDIILRYFKCALSSEYGKKECLRYDESVRTYHNKRIEWYEKRYIQYVDWLGATYWTDKMNVYHQVGYGTSSCLYDGNLEEIRDTLGDYAYLPIQELAAEGVLLPWKDILKDNAKAFIFEKLYKAGLKRFAVEYIRTYIDGIKYRETDLKKILGITKPMLQYMQSHNSGKKVLEVFKDAKKNNYGLNDSEIFELAEAEILVSELKEVSAGSRIIKTLHYLQKANGYSNLKTTYSHYVDYIGMATNMDYDLNNGTVRYPKDLRAAHNKAVSEFYEAEQDKKNREVLIKYPMIRKRAIELNERYGYEDKTYIITAPKNAADIVEEGRTLHHCVGGDGYLNKHNSGKTYILFLRKASEPEERYYTIELDPENIKIIQYYGYNDKKPDKADVDAVLEKWKRQLQRKASREKVAAAG